MTELRQTGRLAGAEDLGTFADLLRLLGVADALELGKRYQT